MKDKKAQQAIVAIMVGIIIFIMLAVFIKPLNEQTTITMNATNLNCTDTSITTERNVTCNIVDYGFFYFVSIMIATSIAVVSGRKKITATITSVFVFIVVVLLITPLKDFIIIARDASHLNCGAASITIGAKLACIAVDLWLFYFIITAITTAVVLIFTKKK